MPYRLGLIQNLPNRAPAAFSVTYTYSNAPAQTWFVQAIGPDRDTSVLVVNSPVDMINQPNVLTRTLHAHYPTAPNTVDIQILTVQLPLAAALGDEGTSLVSQATGYNINVHMTDDTINKLQEGGFFLYGFKGVAATLGGGAPLVWFQTKTYSQDTKIVWEEQYKAYTSNSAIIPNGQITASASYGIDLAQTLEVTGQGGTGQVVHGGVPGAISILNKTTPPKQFTCGISQVQNTGSGPVATPLCAFPLYGTGLDVMAPIQRVLLMFATLEVNTGTVIYKAYSQGVMIDLTGVTTRDVQFDINLGWSWGGGSWGKTVQANADLVPLLIQSQPAALSMSVMGALNVAPGASSSRGNGAAHGAQLEG